MEKSTISEEMIKNTLFQILNEEASKVKREDYNRLQYKMEELQNSLNETMKELRKMEDCVPDGLKTLCNGRVSGISNNLANAQKLIGQLKSKIRKHKKAVYASQQVEDKKK